MYSLFVILLVGILSSHKRIQELLGFQNYDEITIQDAHQVHENIELTSDFLQASYFPREVFSERHEELDNCDDDSQFYVLGDEFDPRLVVGLYLNRIFHSLKSNNCFDPDFYLDFSWSSFVDMKRILDYPRKNPDFMGEDLGDECIENVNFNDSNLSLEFLGPLDHGLSEQTRTIIGLNYLFHSAAAPKRIIFLSIGSTEGIIVPLKKSTLEPRNFIHSLIEEYTTSNDISALQLTLKDQINLINEHSDLQDGVTYTLDSSGFIPIKSISEETKILKQEDFMLNDDSTRIFHDIPSNVDLQHNNSKYFHEALVSGSDAGSHYDWRFFTQLKYSTYERQSILHRMARAWLKFAESASLQTWLAHGSLLGWYWNGLNFPWDQDVDVQMTMSSLIHLAVHYNQSIVVDLDENDISTGTSSYLIDVSSNIFNRGYDNGLNTIDARFIDVSSGMYVDITALSFNNVSDISGLTSKKIKEFNQVLDADFIIKENLNTLDKDELQKHLQFNRKSLVQNKTLLNCKDNHFYKLNELSPLKLTMFEGVRAFVPSNFKMLLKREYSHGLFSKQHEGYTFRPVLDAWIPSKLCKGDMVGNECGDKNSLLEVNYTRPITTKHRIQNQPGFSPSKDEFQMLSPIRVDRWIINRSKKIMQIMQDSNSNMYK